MRVPWWISGLWVFSCENSILFQDLEFWSWKSYTLPPLSALTIVYTSTVFSCENSTRFKVRSLEDTIHSQSLISVPQNWQRRIHRVVGLIKRAIRERGSRGGSLRGSRGVWGAAGSPMVDRKNEYQSSHSNLPGRIVNSTLFWSFKAWTASIFTFNLVARLYIDKTLSMTIRDYARLVFWLKF